MKRKIVAFATMVALMPCADMAARFVVPPVAMPEYADTEVVTNFPINRVRRDAREVMLHFAFEGVTSNCIQVAFGQDADGDGTLSFGETDAVYGWRNGRHFAEDARNRVRTEEADVAAGGTLVVRMRMTKEARPAIFAATNGTGRAMLEGFRSPVPEWLYRPEWNLMRVTRRGPGAPAEWFVCDIRYGDTYIIIR
jgi:hypothetical protein